MRVLVSGFAPFGGRSLNPTSLLVQAIERKEVDYPQELEVETIILPVTFEDSYLYLRNKIRSCNPDVVIALGQAAGRSCIELESLARNTIEAPIQDNKGLRPTGETISLQGPQTYLTTLPIQGMESALKSAGISVKISTCAGAFVCNYLFYKLMEENQETLRLCGFIHVPLLPEQAKPEEPSLSLSELKLAISVILNYINY
jgi:pyroglutamyl-peptidase